MFRRCPQPAHAAYLSLMVAFLLLGLLWQLQPAPASHAQSQPDALGSVSGTVRNAQGDPLPNITVWLEHYRFQVESRKVATNDDGGYEFFSLPSGIYRLRFEDQQKIYATEFYVDADFADDATTVTVNGNDVAGINMELSEGGAISVTLQNSAAITTTAYSVTLYRQNVSEDWAVYRQTMPSPGESSVRFDALPSGSYRLCAEGRSYFGYDFSPAIECYENVRPAIYNQLAPNATDIQVQASAETTVTMKLNDIPQVEGFILTPNGQPLADIFVWLSLGNSYTPQIARTDSDGYFFFGYIGSGSYELVFNYPYFGPNRYMPLYYPNERSTITAQKILVDATTHISVTKNLRPSATITGKVTLPNDVPVSWANVTIYRQRSNGSWSDPGSCIEVCGYSIFDPNTGTYTVTQLIGARYRVRADYFVSGSSSTFSAFYGGSAFESADDVVVNTSETAQNINITVGERQFDSSITGRVTANDEPQVGIEVGLFSQSYSNNESALPLFSTTTDAQGRYTLEGLATGYYQVGFRDPEGVYATNFYSNSSLLFSPNYVAITQTGVVENIDATLTPGGTIRGHIRTQQEQQRSGFAIQVLPSHSDPYATFPLAYIDEKSDANGFFEIGGLPPGIYYLRADTPRGSGDFPNPYSMYYPGEGYPTQWLEVEAGATLEDKDIFFFFTPTNFLPIIGGGTADLQPDLTPLPTEAPPEPPFPPLTPTPTPAIQ